MVREIVVNLKGPRDFGQGPRDLGQKRSERSVATAFDEIVINIPSSIYL